METFWAVLKTFIFMYILLCLLFWANFGPLFISASGPTGFDLKLLTMLFLFLAFDLRQFLMLFIIWIQVIKARDNFYQSECFNFNGALNSPPWSTFNKWNHFWATFIDTWRFLPVTLLTTKLYCQWLKEFRQKNLSLAESDIVQSWAFEWGINCLTILITFTYHCFHLAPWRNCIVNFLLKYLSYLQSR